ncbi:MAG: HlyD family efflux transporter periplasmic adaptor subunit [Acidobacteriota bacterium]|nr:HlyD family efflux transporter periplasmic adaptor subunit [Acidobacteriota bacterium]
MHSNRSRRSVPPWYIILLAGVAAAVVIFGITQLGTSTASASRTSKQDVTAENGVVQSTVSGSGEVEPGVDDTLNFGTSGTLQSVDVKVGQHVKKGQLIATLDPSSARLTLKEAELSLTEAKDNLTSVENGTSSGSGSSGSGSSGSGSTGSGSSSGVSYNSGSTSTAEDVSYTTTTGTTPTPTKTRTNTTPSTTTPSTTTPSTATPTVTVTTTVTTPTKAPTRTTTTTTPTTTTAATNTMTTPSASSIDSAKLSVEQARATVAADKKALRETKLYAPASGRIGSLSSYTIGESVSAGGSSSSGSSNTGSTGTGSSGTGSTGSGSSSSSGFAELINDNTMSMTVSLSEDDISNVKVGQIVTVSITALSGTELAGHVSSISPLGSSSSGVVSYDATITITQNDPKVLPGMSATASIVTAQAQGVTVPNAAITGSGSNASVELVKGGKVTSQAVVVGLKGTSRSQIVSGLKAGQQIQESITLPSLGTSSSNTSTTSSSNSPFGSGGLPSGGFTGGGGLRALLGGGGG